MIVSQEKQNVKFKSKTALTFFVNSRGKKIKNGDFSDKQTTIVSLEFNSTNRVLKINVRIDILYFKKPTFCTMIHFKKHSLIKIISTPTCFGLIRPSSGSCLA